MFVYRVANKKYKGLTLSGVGAEKVGGRWNEVGTRAVYCSENISLALLEYYVHADSRSTLPDSILIAKINIPDKIKIQELKNLPKGWNQYPYSLESSSVFTSLANESNIFALKVPSAIVPLEFNYILNPLSVEFNKIEIIEFIDLELDFRLK